MAILAFGMLTKAFTIVSLRDFASFLLDVLNVSGRFNSQELARDVNGDIQDEPFFEEGHSAPQNVSALIGKTAFLTCVVRNLGKAKSVSQPTFSIASLLQTFFRRSECIIH